MLGLLGLLVAGFMGWRVHLALEGLEGQIPPVPSSQVVQARCEIRHAKGFTLEYRDGCKILRVRRPNESPAMAQVYVLTGQGRQAPQVAPGQITLETPVRRVVSLTTVHAPLFLHLGVPEALVGIAGARYLGTPALAQRVAAGQLVEVGDGQLSMERRLDMEKLHVLSPDLIMVSGASNSDEDQNGKLQEAGFHVATHIEWLEETPLGRAEWIKFAAAFLDREAEAESWFRGIVERYLSLCAKARNIRQRPTVMTGMNFRGTWHVSGGKSYVANFIRDAGGDYLWADSSVTGSLPLKMEAVLARARSADFWLLHMVNAESRQAMLKADNRYGLFKAFQKGALYNNDAKQSPTGGNDYWENGMHRPDLVLADFIAILHPELSPGHVFHWYRKLPGEGV